MLVSKTQVASLLFCSGLSALVYQTAWQKALRLIFGGSSPASAAVLSVFLGGLGLGSLFLGPRIDRSERPLFAYGLYELLISLWAILSLPLMHAIRALYLLTGGSSELSLGTATLARILCTALLIGPPAFLMGGTLPAAARAVTRTTDTDRRGLAELYALNTLGATLGALFGPLWGFSALGAQGTMTVAFVINLGAALAALFISRGGQSMPTRPEDESPRETPERGPRRSPLWIDLTAFISGFVFLSLELVWYRMLSPILGGSTIMFGLILACALSGIFVGGWLFSRSNQQFAPTLSLLSLTLALEAIVLLLPFALGDRLAMLVAQLRELHNLGSGYLLGVWTFVTCLVVVPTSVVSGYQFPLLFSLLGRGPKDVGRQVARAYAFNTAGTVVGALFTGFLLLPWLGAVYLWKGLGLTVFALALALLLAQLWQERGSSYDRELRLSGLALVAFVPLLFFHGPGPFFRHTPIGVGRVRLAGLSPNGVEAFVRNTEASIVWEKEGLEASVALYLGDSYSFIVNGKSDGSLSFDRGTQAFLGLIPAALHPHPESAFVVGLGTGMTAGLLGKVPSMKRVVVAEFEDATVEIARRSWLANEDVLSQDNVELILGDGREVLQSTDELFDLVISAPSNPYRAGISSLFTREYYEACRSRLAKGGYFAQWLQGYEIDAETIAMTLATLKAVFPEVTVWSPERGDLMFLATMAPVLIRVESLEQRLRHPHYQKWLRRAWGMEGAPALMAHFLANNGAVESLASRFQSPINTDDQNLLDAALLRQLGDGRYDATQDLLAASGSPLPLPALVGTLDSSRVLDLRHRSGLAHTKGPGPSAKEAELEAVCKGGKAYGTDPAWMDRPEADLDVLELWAKGLLSARQQLETRALTTRLTELGFTAEAHLIEATGALQQGASVRARQETLEAIRALRDEVFTLCDTHLRTLALALILGDSSASEARGFAEALYSEPFALHAIDGERRLAAAALGAMTGTPADCAQFLGGYRERPLWERGFLTVRSACLRAVNDEGERSAAADLARFESQEASRFSSETSAIWSPEGYRLGIDVSAILKHAPELQ